MFIAERWIDSVANVVRVNERIMYVKLVFGKQIVNIVSAYAPQVVWDLVHETLKVRRFGDALGMVVCNTFFRKESSKLFTYQSGDVGQENRSLSSEGCEGYFK